MQTILLTVALMSIAILFMAIGLLFGKNSIKGSCGGSGGCEVCSNTDDSCKTKSA